MSIAPSPTFAAIVWAGVGIAVIAAVATIVLAIAGRSAAATATLVLAVIALTAAGRRWSR